MLLSPAPLPTPQPDAVPAPAISIVAPCFNEEAVVEEFHRRAAAAARAVAGEDFEIVLVDDGSRDATWAHMRRIAAADPNLVAVRLFRNHGHQVALTAGLNLARGRRILLIDADLQDPPELLADMMRLMDEGADVVYGQRVKREAETLFKKASAALFYRLLRRLADAPIPVDAGDFRLIDRRVADALMAMPERQRFIRGMVSWIGGRQVPLAYERKARFAGETKYPLRKMIRFATDAITSFSVAPLRLAVTLGLVSAALAVALLGYTLFRWIVDATVVGWTSTMTAIALFGSVQLLVLGIMGEYVGRLFLEVKDRPLFMVGQVAARGQVHELPMEFSKLPPQAQREVWAQTLAGTAPAPRG